jgi:hypothetical protein
MRRLTISLLVVLAAACSSSSSPPVRAVRPLSAAASKVAQWRERSHVEIVSLGNVATTAQGQENSVAMQTCHEAVEDGPEYAQGLIPSPWPDVDAEMQAGYDAYMAAFAACAAGDQAAAQPLYTEGASHLNQGVVLSVDRP